MGNGGKCVIVCGYGLLGVDWVFGDGDGVVGEGFGVVGVVYEGGDYWVRLEFWKEFVVVVVELFLL